MGYSPNNGLFERFPKMVGKKQKARPKRSATNVSWSEEERACVDEMMAREGRPVTNLIKFALAELARARGYSWPGNPSA